MCNSQLRVAFANLEHGTWTAGGHYLRNVFAALRSLETERPEIVLLEDAGHSGRSSLAASVDGVIIRPLLPYYLSLQQRLVRKLPAPLQYILEPKPPLAQVLRQNAITCLFTQEVFGAKFDVPVVSWIPDFQHIHLPEMFSAAELRERDMLFQRIVEESALILLSSKTALHDFERFAGQRAVKARVASFVAQPPADVYLAEPGTVCERYHLPQRFFYLPNQFWKHKNHQIVVEALAIACKQRSALTVVCTGNTHDYRNPHYFAQLLATIAERSLRNSLIMLGFVPHHDTFRLMRQAVSVLQPSLFEGWSTTLEEARSIGKGVVASDIPTHREQNLPQAHYFQPHDAEGLAALLIELFDNAPEGPDLVLEAQARAQLPQRTHSFGETLRAIFCEASSA